MQCGNDVAAFELSELIIRYHLHIIARRLTAPAAGDIAARTTALAGQFYSQDTGAGGDNGPFYNVLKLPDVAGPIVALQPVHRSGREFEHRTMHLAANQLHNNPRASDDLLR